MQRAERRGLITRDELAAVVAGARGHRRARDHPGGLTCSPATRSRTERRAVGDLATPLDDELGLLNVNLAIWMARDDSKADASVTRAGNQVLDSIDAMLGQLHQLRARMVGERREDQDAAAARADALLERCRQLRQEADQ